MNDSYHELLVDVLGNDALERMIYLNSLRQAFLTYYYPIVTSLTFILNLIVFLLCLPILQTTKKINHKTAFLLIAFLSFFDMLVGRY